MGARLLPIPLLLLSWIQALPWTNGVFVVRDEGTVHLFGATARVVVVDDRAAWVVQGGLHATNEPDFPRSDEASHVWKGTLHHSNLGELSLSQVVSVQPGGMDLSIHYRQESRLDLGVLCWRISLPAAHVEGRNIRVDGVPYPVARSFDKNFTRRIDARKVQIELSNGTFVAEGDFQVVLEDGRKAGGQSVNVNLLFDSWKGFVPEARLKVRLSEATIEGAFLDLSPWVNAPLKAEPGRFPASSTTTNSPDLTSFPSKGFTNGGLVARLFPRGSNSLVALSGGAPRVRKSFTIPLRRPGLRRLHLLHAAAGAAPGEALGRVRLVGPLGTRLDFPIFSDVQAGSWWQPTDRKEGRLFFSAPCGGGYAGLTLSTFEFDPMDVESITLEGTGKGVWLVAGLSLSREGGELLDLRVPRYRVAGPDWISAPGPFDSAPWSPLDLSRLPALSSAENGRGRLVVTNGRFETTDRPGRRVRLFGATLGAEIYALGKPESTALLGRLSRMGVNALWLRDVGAGLVASNRPAGVVRFEEVLLDRFDWLVGEAKRSGMKVFLSGIANRNVIAGEIEGFTNLGRSSYQILVLSGGAAREDWKRWTFRLLLDHVNPYLGTNLGKDSVLGGLELLSEDSLEAMGSGDRQVSALLRDGFTGWLRRMNLMRQAADPGLFFRYLAEIQRNAASEMIRDLRLAEIDALVTDATLVDGPRLLGARSLLDFVETHGRWDEPNFFAGTYPLPRSFHLKSPLGDFSAPPAIQAPSRIFGKPFVAHVTPFWPNPYRVRGILLASAIAGTQDWDALVLDGWANSSNTVNGTGRIERSDLLNDPSAFLAAQMAALSFHRGDVPAAAKAAVFRPSAEFLRDGIGFPSEGWCEWPAVLSSASTGLRLGVAPGEGRIPGESMSIGAEDLWPSAGREPKGPRGAGEGIRRGDGAEITWNTNAESFVLVASNVEGLTLGERGSAKGRFLEARSSEGRAVLWAASLDGLPLVKSARIALTHLTRAVNSLQMHRIFAGASASGSEDLDSVLEDWGRAPVLLREAKVRVTLNHPDADRIRVFACDPSGRRLFEAVREKDGEGRGFTFLARVSGKGGAPVALYDVVVGPSPANVPTVPGGR